MEIEIIIEYLRMAGMFSMRYEYRATHITKDDRMFCAYSSDSEEKAITKLLKVLEDSKIDDYPKTIKVKI